jgi:hypothetical protein
MKDVRINKVTPQDVKFNPWDVDNYDETGIYLTEEGLMFVHKNKLVVKYICSAKTAETMKPKPSPHIGYLEVLVLLFALGLVLAVLIPNLI